MFEKVYTLNRYAGNKVPEASQCGLRRLSADDGCRRRLPRYPGPVLTRVDSDDRLTTDRIIRIAMQIRIRSKFSQNSGKFVRIHQIPQSENWKFEESSTSFQIFGEIPIKSHQNR